MMHPSAVSARLVINGLSHSLERDWRILAAAERAVRVRRQRGARVRGSVGGRVRAVGYM